MVNGEKTNSEKNFVKSIKALQQDSCKQSKKLFQLALRNTLPIFKMNKITSRKKKKRRKRIIERPAFIRKNSARISLALKFMIATTRKKKDFTFSHKLKQEIILAAQYKGDSIEYKKDLQKRVFAKKHVFKYYRW
jgi:ribosomal protein S7